MNFQLRKTYRNEIYSYRPSWILRWGITVSFLFLFIIVFVSAFIKYPDIIIAQAEITTVNPPVHLLARVEGKIKRIMVAEGDRVREGDILVIMETPVNYGDIITLNASLRKIDSMITNGIVPYSEPAIFSSHLQLGELQASYSELLMNYNDLYTYYLFNYKQLELKSKQEERENELKYNNLLLEKSRILKLQFNLAHKDFQRDSFLFADGVIPEKKFTRSKQQNDLQYRSLITDLSMSIATSQFTLTKLQREMENILIQDKENKLQLKLQLKQRIRLLRTAIKVWEQNYLVVSPIDGLASFTQFWNENQNVHIGNTVVSVVPEDDLLVKTRIQFPVKNSGKVQSGQRVNIKLEKFPYQEFGMLVGEMGDISKVPNGSFYSADVILSEGLVTSYGDRLPLAQQGAGHAEILTAEVSLLMRFFNPVKAIFDEHI